MKGSNLSSLFSPVSSSSRARITRPPSTKAYFSRLGLMSTSSESGQWSKYITKIGLEIHTQINAKSKLFSRSPRAYISPPNSNVSLFDCAVPGTLPVINQYCVEAAVKCGLALNSKISSSCCFDRKHYFYPDTPSGYQITQKREPIAYNGYLRYPVFKWSEQKVSIKRARLKAIQLEQDAGKTLQYMRLNQNFLDLNRCGIGLMEFVFEPDLSDETEAVFLVKELMQILKKLNVCNCKMEEGALRIDANISVASTDGKQTGNRVELKNLNSLNSLTRALDFERKRHIEVLKKGSSVISETRFYNPSEKLTYPMRRKDDLEDYRYIPEPNLPPLYLSFDQNFQQSQQVISVPLIKNGLPMQPDEEREVLIKKFQVPLHLAAYVVYNNMYQFIVDVIALDLPVSIEAIAQFVGIELTNCLRDLELNLEGADLSPEFVGECLLLIEKNEITTSMALDVVCLFIRGDKMTPSDLIKEHGWRMIQDQNLVQEECNKMIELYPHTAFKAKKGSHSSLVSLCEGVEKKSDKRFSRSAILTTLKSILENKDPEALKTAAKAFVKQVKESAHAISEIDAITKSKP